jgi:hypothetical protein
MFIVFGLTNCLDLMEYYQNKFKRAWKIFLLPIYILVPLKDK